MGFLLKMNERIWTLGLPRYLKGISPESLSI